MEEMKKGLFRDYHSNGEPKTFEQQDKECTYALIIGLFLVIGGFSFFMFNIIK